jgi:glycosyltransferase involved in cell wall biosynthesis
MAHPRDLLPKGLKVALVHDWVNGYRGGEKVLHGLCELFPAAELFTLFHVPGSSHPVIENRPIHASWMNRIPGVQDRYRWLLPLFPAWADNLDLSEFDLVVSTSHCVAKGARARAGAVNVCYSFTPMRYVWDRFDDYFGEARGLKRKIIDHQAARLREWDRRSAQRVDQFLADSSFVRDRILRFYRMPPERVEVLFPPVDLEAFPAAPREQAREDRYLVLSALVPYKKVDLAVEACARSGRRLVVAGKGPEMSKLEAIVQRHGAQDRIELRGHVPDEELPSLMAGSRAFLFPGIEDFGITPLEAAASGLPVLAYAEGGALDTVCEGVSGHLYPGAGVEGLLEALDRFEAENRDWDRDAMREHAASFSRDRFLSRLAERLNWALQRGPVRTERS